MVTCDYCGKEMPKKNFCCAAHKMAYRRKGVTGQEQKELDVTYTAPAPEVQTKASYPDLNNKPTFRKSACKKHRIFTCGCKETETQGEPKYKKWGDALKPPEKKPQKDPMGDILVGVDDMAQEGIKYYEEQFKSCKHGAKVGLCKKGCK